MPNYNINNNVTPNTLINTDYLKYYLGASKVNLSASQKSDNRPNPAVLLAELAESMSRELGEWEGALSTIATQVEALQEIGNLLQDRISTLRKVANLPGIGTETEPQAYQPQPAQAPEPMYFAPQQGGPTDGAGQALTGQLLWQQDLGQPY